MEEVTIPVLSLLDEKWCKYSEAFIQARAKGKQPWFLYHCTRGAHFDNYPHEKFLAKWGEYGITVNALAPGLTRTRAAIAGVPQAHFDFVKSRQAVKRSGEPEDQAAALAYLVSDEAGFISGQTLLVDGGEGHV